MKQNVIEHRRKTRLGKGKERKTRIKYQKLHCRFICSEFNISLVDFKLLSRLDFLSSMSIDLIEQ